MSEIAIRASGLVKDFKVYDRPRDIALEVLTRRARHKTFRALDGVSFEVKRGEVVGIIGHNGAGKSTLLKIITGVLDATAGEVEVAGRVTAILELGLGFNAELPGRSNIHLSGLLYGMTHAEIDSKLASIVEFSGLGEFIDRPVKTYSSGMQARLAFSIASAVDPDILIIDEALAAGDATFVQKCLRRIRELCSGGRTVLVVSHGTSLLAQLCQRVLWLDAGKVRAIGSPMSVVQAYDLAAHQGADSKSWIETVPDDEVKIVAAPAPAAAAAPVGPSAVAADAASAGAFAPKGPADVDATASTGRQALRRGPVLIDGVQLLDANRNTTSVLTTLKPFTIRVAYHCDGPIPEESVGVAVSINQDGDLTAVMQWFSQNIRPTETRETYPTATFRKRAHRRGIIELGFTHTPFRAGTYILSIGLLPNEPGNWMFWEYRHFFYKFRVEEAGLGIGAFMFLEPHCLHVDAADDTSGAIKSRLPPPTLRAEIREICFGEGKYPDGWPRHEACPVCRSTVLHDAFAKDKLSHRRCGACDFVFMDPYPTDAIIAKLYAGRYYTNTRELFELPRLKAGGQGTPYSAPPEDLDAIIEKGTAGRDRGTWLDVGGGIGAFAARIAAQRPGWRTVLNEFNPRSVEIARELPGVEVTSADAKALAAAGQAFDAISMIAVLEHIPDPRSMIEEYGRLLAPGGLMAIVVPNFTRLSAHVAQASSASVGPPFHVSLFNRDNLAHLLGATGLFASIDLQESGPAAFQLVHHVPFADYFDITMPTVSEPVPSTVMPTPYEPVVGQRIAALAEADTRLGSFFADTDGRLLLTAFARRG